MSRPTVALVSIVGHAEKDLPRMLASVGRGPDGSPLFEEYGFLIDGTSQDATEDLIAQFCRNIDPDHPTGTSAHAWIGRADLEEGFDKSWNRLFADVTSDWIFFMASDEELIHPEQLRDELAKVPENVATAAVRFREMLVSRPGLPVVRALRTKARVRYFGTTHSSLGFASREDEKRYIDVPPVLDGIRLHHHKSPEAYQKSKERHLQMAQKAVESGIEPRAFNMHLLANAMVDLGMHEEAVATWRTALSIAKDEPWIRFAKRSLERIERRLDGRSPFLGVCVIVKDVSKTIDALCLSIVAPEWGPAFDEYVFVDTGSTDDTIEKLNRWRTIAEENGCYFYVIGAGDRFEEHGGFHFGNARAYSFARATAEWRAWVDSDDQFLGCEYLWNYLRGLGVEVNCLSMFYDYAPGSLMQDMKRVFRWSDTKITWQGRIHEEPVCACPLRIERIDAPHLDIAPPFAKRVPFYVLHANADPDKSMERNEKLLQVAYEHDGPEARARAAYFIGHSAMVKNQFEKARTYLAEAFRSNRWNYIGVLAGSALSDLAVLQLDYDAALDIAGMTHAMSPEQPEPLWSMGMAHFHRKDWERAAMFLERAMAISKMQGFRAHRNVQLEERDGPLRLIEALRMSGRVDDAKKIHEGLRLDGDAWRLVGNRLARDQYTRDLRSWVIDGLRLWGLSAGTWNFATALAHLPEWFLRDPQVRMVRSIAEGRIAHAHDPDLYQRRYRDAANSQSRGFDEGLVLMIANLDRTKLLLREVSGMRAPRILSLGPNSGHMEVMALDANPKATCMMVEADEILAAELRERWARFGDRLHVVTTVDPKEWPEVTGGYDLIVAYELIEHVPSPTIFLGHVTRVLGNGGKLLLSTPNIHDWMPDINDSDKLGWHPHIHGFEPKMLYDLLRQTGFYVDRLEIDSTGLLLVTARKSYEKEVDLHIGGEVYEKAVLVPYKNLGKTVDILASSCYVPFDAEAHKNQFVSGSEEAIIHVAPLLRKLGWTVRVWTNLGEDGVFSTMPRRGLRVLKDVLWEPSEAFDPNEDRDAVIIWRNVAALKVPMKGKKVLWLHDATVHGMSLDAADAVMFLSQSHKQSIEEELGNRGIWNVRFIQNGIDLEDFPEPDESIRDASKGIYCSSPDRGLELLLDLWPQIRGRCQARGHKATLDIYYGFSNSHKMPAPTELRQALLRMEETILGKIDALKDQGVMYHDGVSHPVLHKAMREAGAWLYPHPKSYVETSCITAMKMLAAGVIPVTTDSGALPETLSDLPPEVPLLSAESLETELGKERYVDRAVEVLCPTSETVAIRSRLRQAALKRFGWEVAADRIHEVLLGVVR